MEIWLSEIDKIPWKGWHKFLMDWWFTAPVNQTYLSLWLWLIAQSYSLWYCWDFHLNLGWQGTIMTEIWLSEIDKIPWKGWHKFLLDWWFSAPVNQTYLGPRLRLTGWWSNLTFHGIAEIFTTAGKSRGYILTEIWLVAFYYRVLLTKFRSTVLNGTVPLGRGYFWRKS